MAWNRRKVLKTGLGALSEATLAPILLQAAGATPIESTDPVLQVSASKPVFNCFTERGYYITFMRGTTFSFETWKDIFRAVQEDGGNLILLWMGGAFPSRKFPITWKYNAEHQNIQHNFAGKLIDYAHSLNMRVLLCLTPFGYDGVNQYALEHPELKAINKQGNFTAASGLGAWGYNLNPYREQSQQFMLEYTREMMDFYPNADGLFLESSDYAASYCSNCAETYYQKEFQFVRQISDEVWARKPDAFIVIYPHYFSSAEVPGMGIHGSTETFDPRWGLFFTPHSTLLAPNLISKARNVLYWDPSPSFGNPRKIQAAAQTARAAGVTGFVPSFEPWTYVLKGPEEGDQFMVGQRLAPFGFGWPPSGASPARELLMRVDRLAYREFSRHPDLPFEDYRQTLSRELFAGNASPEVLDDLLFLEESFFLDRSWVSVCAIASSAYVKGRIEMGGMSPDKLYEYRRRHKLLAELVKRYDGTTDITEQEMRRIAQWILDQWRTSPGREIVEAHIG